MPRFLLLIVFVLLAGCGAQSTGGTEDDGFGAPAPNCGPEWQQLSLDFSPELSKTYAYLPFLVGPGVQRVELRYGWTARSPLPSTPLTGTTVDLGLWDARGLRSGFRGWGGSRQGRLDRDTGPVFVEAQSADRGFYPGPIQAGRWHIELGLAATDEFGADVLAEFRCLGQAEAEPRPAGPRLDPSAVRNPNPGWYAADFHMHGYHSNPAAPDWEGVIAQAREAGLQVLMLTDYVTDRHHRELTQAQAAHPDLLLWPGREVITYFGHANIHGEVSTTPDYRHGWEDLTLGLIQDEAVADGALFQINHPTTFPPPLFSNLCRGCAFELDSFIDFDQVHLVEVVNAAPVANGSDIGLPIPGEIENPFTSTAIEWWLDRLRAGYRLTAVSGSDSKGVDAPEERTRKGYGSSATRIGADSLSRPALKAALLEGRAYIQVRGVNDSPEAELLVSSADGQSGTFGSSLQAGSANLQITLRGASGQLLTIFRDQLPVVSVPVLTDPYVHEQPIFRLPLEEGPLGTIWRFEVSDSRSRTIISNPVFLRPATP